MQISYREIAFIVQLLSLDPVAQISSGLECEVAPFLCCEQHWWEKHVLPFVTEIGAGGDGVLIVSVA